MAVKTSDRDLNDLVEEAEEDGWTVTKTKGGHLKWVPPSGSGCFFSASTPTSARVTQHARLQMRRCMAGLSSHKPAAQNEVGMQNLNHRLLNEKLEKEKKAMTTTLTAKFPSLLPPEREVIFHLSARKKMRELMANGRSPEDSATVVSTAFKVIHPVLRTEFTHEQLVRLATKEHVKRGEGTHAKRSARERKEADARQAEIRAEAEKLAAKKTPKAVAPAPVAAAPTPAPSKPVSTSGEVDEKLRHIRAVIDMPFDKSKKLEIIIDLLDKIL